MSKFNYVLSNSLGRKEEGVISAASKQDAIKKLSGDGKVILAVTDFKAKSLLSLLKGRPYLTLEERMLFVKNLATMVKVGITIVEALKIMMEQYNKERIRRLFEDLIEMINSGQTLGKSLESYNYIFSKLFINMVATGEKSGNLERVLQYLDVQLEKEYELRKKIISAFMYPAVIVSITLMLGIGIVIFIMPKITDVFKSFDIELPLPTRILIGTSNFISGKPLITLLLAGGVVGFFVTIFRLKALKPFWHRVVLRMPIFGGLLVAGNVARFARTLNSLLQSSVPITESLRITGDMLNNTMYRNALFEAADKVDKGAQLGESLEDKEKLFPTLAVKMIEIGERTGCLDTTTEKIAELYEKAVDSKTKNLSVIIEPILLVMMSALVGGIALSIIMPIYQLPNLLSR